MRNLCASRFCLAELPGGEKLCNACKKRIAWQKEHPTRKISMDRKSDPLKWIKKYDQRMCRGKVCYDKRGATTARNSRLEKGEKYLRIFPCPVCRFWHLTHKPRT